MVAWLPCLPGYALILQAAPDVHVGRPTGPEPAASREQAEALQLWLLWRAGAPTWP